MIQKLRTQAEIQAVVAQVAAARAAEAVQAAAQEEAAAQAVAVVVHRRILMYGRLKRSLLPAPKTAKLS